MSRYWLVGLGVASACGRQLHTHEPGVDYLAAIRLEGNRAIATGALEPALALHEVIRDGGALDPYLLTADSERIHAAYVRHGFFEATVTSRVEHRDAHTQLAVFTITEGRRAATRVEITGLPPELAPARARGLVALADGAPFDYDTYDAAKQPLTMLVENAGYAHAKVDGKVDADPSRATATVRYTVEPGVRCTFGKITIAGKFPASLEAAVHARLRFAEGDRYSVSAIEETQAELYGLGRFSTVHIGPDHRDGTTDETAAVIHIAVELSEANRYELHGGGGLGYEPLTFEARLRGGGSLVPARLPLMTLAADARVALTIPHDFDQTQIEPKVRGLVSLQYLDLLWPRLRGEVEAGADYQTVEAYTWTGEHTRLGLGTPLGPRWLQLRVGWLLEHLTFNPDPAVDTKTVQELGLNRPQLRGAYQASLVADLRDNPIDPHRGVYVDLRVTKGTRLAGGDLTYLQLTPELRGYVSLGGTVIAARARVGAIFGDVPVTERYFSGGTSGQRGFSDRRLSPTVPPPCVSVSMMPIPCKVIGGAGLIETGVELRRELGTWWTFPVGTNLFLDGGDVTNKPEQLDPWNLYWAIGAGVWSKLVGDLKIRIDLGYRLNRTEPPDPFSSDHWYQNIALHLGIGEAY